ncbi:MAG TPA: energy transducer TonB [Verrucomicrobiae bacterium]|jgi:hypothetical protein
MARAGLSSLRLGRSDAERLLAALLLSLLVHLATWGGYELGKKFGWWQAIHLPAWLHKTAKKNPQLAQTPPEAEPQIFVDVLQSDPEPPKKTVYYSDKNAHAANLDEDKNLNRPKLNGKQADSHKTEDTPKFSKLQPSPPPQPQQQTQPQPMPAAPPKTETSPFNKGDVKANKSTDTKTETQKNAPPHPPQPPRPRTLNAAREQLHLPGQQMKQDGGAHRRLQASFDVKATPFGDYDRRLIEAVQQRWDDLLTTQRFAGDRTGRVQVHFRLTNDGTVESVTIVSSSVGELFSYMCQASIEEAAPFGKWPDDMRQQIGKNFRDITFTFDYY